MPDILSKYKEVNHGTPIEDDDDNMTKWNEIIDKIIDGFEASKELDDAHIKTNFEDYLAEVKLLERRRRKGMILFVKYYNDLWD